MENLLNCTYFNCFISNQCTNRGKDLDVRSTCMTLFFSFISVELRASLFFFYHKVDTDSDIICKRPFRHDGLDRPYRRRMDFLLVLSMPCCSQGRYITANSQKRYTNQYQRLPEVFRRTKEFCRMWQRKS